MSLRRKFKVACQQITKDDKLQCDGVETGLGMTEEVKLRMDGTNKKDK